MCIAESGHYHEGGYAWDPESLTHHATWITSKPLEACTGSTLAALAALTISIFKKHIYPFCLTCKVTLPSPLNAPEDKPTAHGLVELWDDKIAA